MIAVAIVVAYDGWMDIVSVAFIWVLAFIARRKPQPAIEPATRQSIDQAMRQLSRDGCAWRHRTFGSANDESF
jgi:hypothetical protein